MRNQFYDSKQLCRYLAILIVLGLTMKFTQGAALIVLVPMAFYSLSKRDAYGVLWAVLIAVVSIVTNSWLMPKGLVYVIIQRGIMTILGCVMLFQIAGQKSSPLVKPMLPILVYILYMIPVSIKGWAPIISMLKLFLFAVVFIALFASANSAINSKGDARKIRNMFLAVACFFVFGSLLVMPIGSIAYMNANELMNTPDVKSLFKGLMVHSQTLGPSMAMIGILIFSDLVFVIQRIDKLYIAMLLIIPFLIIKTGSRTGMGAFIAGVMIVTYRLLKAKGIKISWRNKVFSLLMVTAIVGMIVILTISQTRESVFNFIIKYGDGDVALTSENILKSREHKLNSAIDNWRRSPWVGNGFQVSEDMYYTKIDSIGTMLSAPVEKSTWAYAILEEGGIIGEIIFVIFLFGAIFVMYKRQAYVGATLLFSFMMLNFGEFTFFSMSGCGGFFWELVFLGCVIDAKRLQVRRVTQNNMFWVGYARQE